MTSPADRPWWFEDLPTVQKVGGCWVLHAKRHTAQTLDQVLLDTNVLIDARAFFQSRPVGDEFATAWRWIRSVMGRKSGLGPMARPSNLPLTLPAIQEACWPLDRRLPDPARAEAILGAVHEICSWSTAETAINFKPGVQRTLRVSSRSRRWVQTYGRHIGVTRVTDVLFRDWLSVLLLMETYQELPALAPPRRRLDALTDWRALQASESVGCSAEIKGLARVVLLGGSIQAANHTKLWLGDNLLKRAQWKKIGHNAVARNLAWDAQLLYIWRRYAYDWQEENSRVGIITKDAGLAALHSLFANAMTDKDRDGYAMALPADSAINSLEQPERVKYIEREATDIFSEESIAPVDALRIKINAVASRLAGK